MQGIPIMFTRLLEGFLSLGMPIMFKGSVSGVYPLRKAVC